MFFISLFLVSFIHSLFRFCSLLGKNPTKVCFVSHILDCSLSISRFVFVLLTRITKNKKKEEKLKLTKEISNNKFTTGKCMDLSRMSHALSSLVRIIFHPSPIFHPESVHTIVTTAAQPVVPRKKRKEIEHSHHHF